MYIRPAAILKVFVGLTSFDFLSLEQFRGDGEGGQGVEEDRPGGEDHIGRQCQVLPFRVPPGAEAAVSSARMAEQVGDPRLTSDRWHEVKPEQEQADREVAAKAETERQRQWEEANPLGSKWWSQNGGGPQA
jgi:hypothetical protein